jgi:hypothetical protein
MINVRKIANLVVDRMINAEKIWTEKEWEDYKEKHPDTDVKPKFNDSDNNKKDEKGKGNSRSKQDQLPDKGGNKDNDPNENEKATIQSVFEKHNIKEVPQGVSSAFQQLHEDWSNGEDKGTIHDDILDAIENEDSIMDKDGFLNDIANTWIGSADERYKVNFNKEKRDQQYEKAALLKEVADYIVENGIQGKAREQVRQEVEDQIREEVKKESEDKDNNATNKANLSNMDVEKNLDKFLEENESDYRNSPNLARNNLVDFIYDQIEMMEDRNFAENLEKEFNESPISTYHDIINFIHDRVEEKDINKWESTTSNIEEIIEFVAEKHESDDGMSRDEEGFDKELTKKVDGLIKNTISSSGSVDNARAHLDRWMQRKGVTWISRSVIEKIKDSSFYQDNKVSKRMSNYDINTENIESKLDGAKTNDDYEKVIKDFLSNAESEFGEDAFDRMMEWWKSLDRDGMLYLYLDDIRDWAINGKKSKKAARGFQVRRKDKDTMSDTGGSSKGRDREPSQKPPRDDVKKTHRTKRKTKDERDPDNDNDPDKRADKRASMARNIAIDFIARRICDK